MVVPEMQRKGVATLLLKKVCVDAAENGYDFVEAYPKKSFVSAAEDFMGPAELFKKCGFTVHSETDDIFVMRKVLG